ncbi:uncharacterized protein BCR38DRAFT_338067 [Pseudomassariella vexata]|uniref:Short chain dehydrogenase n=1 Tax=Pseudomassariella vexata TaxID=1141098 RepID=A0A1Y2E8R2_9PEZI|nr:uncharacterized protein BCR38DRAFT_338067 [Pseudomassariella vexata]ORY67255.1 hypothetical protein BCR38DRAFT_338067 [Pseudomassariella vexata]
MASALQGTTVIVTGGAGGLGKAIATAYVNAGANVVICDINDERLAATSADFEATGRFLALKTDITCEAAVQSLIEQTTTKFGRLDILVNNAGMMDGFDPVGELSKENWDRVLNLNLTGSFLCMKSAVNAMQRQEPRGGLIIQIGSNASHQGTNAGLVYTVSKHGVAALVKNTAGFYADQNIYAVGLMMGAMIDTNITESTMKMGWFNQEGFTKFFGEKEFNTNCAIKLADAGKYCVFLADRDIAATLNGSLINFNKNWPQA